MRPRLVLLLALVASTLVFMAFLVKQQSAAKMTCQKGVCTETAPPSASDGGGEPETDNGSFHHLIVSTIK